MGRIDKGGEADRLVSIYSSFPDLNGGFHGLPKLWVRRGFGNVDRQCEVVICLSANLDKRQSHDWAKKTHRILFNRFRRQQRSPKNSPKTMPG